MQSRLARGLAWGLALCACGGEDSTVTGSGALSLVTLNAAIGVGLAPYAPERLAAIERDLPGLDADIVCLQELWQPEDMERLSQALLQDYPYSQRAVQAGAGAGSDAACTPSEAASLLACLHDHCADVDEAGLPLCAIANCAMAFTAVSMSCQQCVVANQSARDVEQLVQVCSAADGAAASYEDQNGLLLLSRLPLSDPDFLRLESSLGDRGVLSARVRNPAGGTLRLYCTHLAASLADVPYTGRYGSWQGERVQQIERWLDWVEETRGSADAVALMGDLNCGPETSFARSASPDAFERFAGAGFDDPYAADDGRCTFCANNPLNGSVSDPDEGALIDHILFSAVPSTLTRAAARVFDQTIEVDTRSGSVQTAHSDHYGVQITLSSPEP